MSRGSRPRWGRGVERQSVCGRLESECSCNLEWRECGEGGSEEGGEGGSVGVWGGRE